MSELMNNEITNGLGQYVTAADLAAALKLRKAAVYRMCDRGILPAGIKIGARRRWSVAEVKQCLEALNSEHKKSALDLGTNGYESR